MKDFQIGPTTITANRKYNYTTWVGLPFLLIGLSLLPKSFLSGIVFVVLGILLFFSGGEVKIQKYPPQLISRWSLLGMGKSTVWPLQDPGIVQISGEMQESGNSPYKLYVVRVRGIRPAIAQSREHADARARAEQVAKFLNISVVDDSD